MSVRSCLTVREAAARIGVGPWTIRKLEMEGRIPPARRDPLSRYRVYDDADIARIRAAIAEMGQVAG